MNKRKSTVRPASSSKASERRGGTRRAVRDGVATVYSGTRSIECRILNVSTGGLGLIPLRATIGPYEGERVGVAFRHGELPYIVATARVRWRSDDRIGLAFEDIADADVARMGRG